MKTYVLGEKSDICFKIQLLCAVNTVFPINPAGQCRIWGRAMPQVLSRRPLVEEARVRSRNCQCEIYGEQSATWTRFLRALRFSAVKFHSTNASYSSSSTCCSYQKDKRADVGTFQKQYSFGNRRVLYRELLSHFAVCCENHTKHTNNTVCVIAVFFNVKRRGT